MSESSGLPTREPTLWISHLSDQSPQLHKPIPCNKFPIQEQCPGFPGGSAVKNLPAIQETLVQSLGQEDLFFREE